MNLLDPIDTDTPAFGDLYDELPLWLAPFGLWILDRVRLGPHQTVPDLGAGTGFLSVELAERCGPGATFLLTTNRVGHMAEFNDVYRKVLVRAGQTRPVAALDEHVSHRATVESVSRLLAEAGFEPTEVTNDAFRLRFADGCARLRHFFIRLGFLPAWKDLVPADPWATTFAALESELNAVAAQRGELSLTIPMTGIVATKTGEKPATSAGGG